MRTAGKEDGAGAGVAPALCFERVSFRYPDAPRDALSGVDLELRRGEILALVGGNGSGKSTLARLCNGLILPSQGRVTVSAARTPDADVLCTARAEDLWDVRSRVGLLFQDPDDQIVGATVEDDVAFGLENLGVERAEMRRRVAAILQVVGLSSERSTETHLLSGGQKQRLALAGVLVLHPSVLVLDEPTSMLDPLGREEILGFVRRLASEGVAVLMITQHMDEAVAADRLAALEDGRLVYVGDARGFFQSGAYARLPLGDPPALLLARELEAVLGPGCAGRWPADAPPLTETDLAAALTSAPVRSGAAPWRVVRSAHTAPDPDVQDDGEGYAARLRGVDVTYNARTSLERRALRAVDLEIPSGAVIAVVGPTASGKTTLLQAVAGLIPVSAGVVEVFGRREARPGQVGMVMQRAEMQLFCATVREDVAVAPRLAGLEGRALELRVEDALEAVGLDPAQFGSRSPHALSLGEQRRVALAGILSLSPRLLILDEPGAGLDPLMRFRLMEELLAWREEGGRTLLYASHDLEEVARVAGRVVLLAEGKVVAEGSAREVLGHEAVMRAAGLGPPLAARVAVRAAARVALAGAPFAAAAAGLRPGPAGRLPTNGLELAEWLVGAEAAAPMGSAPKGEA